MTYDEAVDTVAEILCRKWNQEQEDSAQPEAFESEAKEIVDSLPLLLGPSHKER